MRHILHIEIGAVYAGSTAVLQNHLLCGSADKWRHSILFRSEQARAEFVSKIPPGILQQIEIVPELESDVVGCCLDGRAGRPLYGGVKTESGRRRSGRLRTMAGLARYYMQTVLPESRAWERFLKGRPYDLVQLHNGPLGMTQAIIGVQKCGFPLTARLQSFIDPSPLDRRFLGRPRHYIAVADAIKFYYAERGIPVGRITTCHEGLVEEEFSLPAGHETVKSELGIGEDQPLVGLVGRLVWWKGHDYFVEAAAEVSKRYPEVRFVIVGGPDDTEPDYDEQLKGKVRDLGLSDRVIFTGYRSDARRFTAALDIAVLASCLPEPGGRSVLEALAMGRPSIITDAGGMPEYAGRDGSASLLVPVRDSHAMAEAMIALLSDPDRAERMGRAAHERMYSSFHMQQTVAKHEQVWESVLDGGNE